MSLFHLGFDFTISMGGELEILSESSRFSPIQIRPWHQGFRVYTQRGAARRSVNFTLPIVSFGDYIPIVALAREGQSPTVMAVRARLGGGSPNTITPLLAEWKSLNETRAGAEAMPPVPEPAEAVMRQVWGAAWKEARGQIEGEREALVAARKEMQKERPEMLAEIGRLDTELEAARGTTRARESDLEEERHGHEQTRSQVREAQAVAAERERRLTSLEQELQGLHRQLEDVQGQTSRIEAERDYLRGDLHSVRDAQRQEQENAQRLAAELEAAQRQADEARSGTAAERERAQRLEQTLDDERRLRTEAEQALTELRIQTAALTERAAHIDELRLLLRRFQGQLESPEDGPKSGRRTKPRRG